MALPAVSVRHKSDIPPEATPAWSSLRMHDTLVHRRRLQLLDWLLPVQVRCIVAVLLMVGHGHERPEVVQQLLDTAANPRKPQYTMAAEVCQPTWLEPATGIRSICIRCLFWHREQQRRGSVVHGMHHLVIFHCIAFKAAFKRVPWWYLAGAAHAQRMCVSGPSMAAVRSCIDASAELSSRHIAQAHPHRSPDPQHA